MNKRPVAHIDQSTCDGCPTCSVRSICPQDAVVPDPSGRGRAWKVEESKCAGCLLCAPYCSHHAVVPRVRGKAA